MLCIQTERKHRVVREGFQILLRIDAELHLPVDAERIRDFYQRMSEACVKWAEEVEGERLRSRYLGLESNRERARFRTGTYRLICLPVWEDERHASWLCESVLTGQDGMSDTRRMSQVWNLCEQTLLPLGQILRLFPPKKRPPFRPDGVYPTENELVFFRNAEGDCEMREFRISIRKAQEMTEM